MCIVILLIKEITISTRYIISALHSMPMGVDNYYMSTPMGIVSFLKDSSLIATEQKKVTITKGR